jgi:hypothetical protein
MPTVVQEQVRCGLPWFGQDVCPKTLSDHSCHQQPRHRRAHRCRCGAELRVAEGG